MLVAMSQPSDSPTRAAAEMRQKATRGSMATMSNIGIVPLGIDRPVSMKTSAEITSVSHGTTNNTYQVTNAQGQVTQNPLITHPNLATIQLVTAPSIHIFFLLLLLNEKPRCNTVIPNSPPLTGLMRPTHLPVGRRRTSKKGKAVPTNQLDPVPHNLRRP
jgi:hypothetical protein